MVLVRPVGIAGRDPVSRVASGRVRMRKQIGAAKGREMG